MKLYGIVGIGGFGREVMPLANALLKKTEMTDYELVFIDERKPSNSLINGYKVLTPEEFFCYPSKEKFFNIAIANHSHRRKMANWLIENEAKPFHVQALNSIDLGPNVIADGAILCPFTTITANAKIGKFFHANIYSYIAHDCIIGDYVTFAPNVHCNGNVIIEDDVYIGTGAIIREGTADKPMIIGKGAIIGMGAVVTKPVPAFETVIGNPARVMERKNILNPTA